MCVCVCERERERENYKEIDLDCSIWEGQCLAALCTAGSLR